MDSKTVKKMINKVIDVYGASAVDTLDKIKKLGFEFATRSGITWGMGDLTVPKEKPGLIKEAEEKIKTIDDYYEKGLLSRDEKTTQIIEVWKKVKSEIEKLVPQSISSKSPVFSIIDSGSRGSWSQPVQMAGMKGLVASPTGKIIELAVKNSYRKVMFWNTLFQLMVLEKVLLILIENINIGYLTRRLIDVAHEVIVNEKDCGDKEGLVVSKKMLVKLIRILLIRYLAEFH